MLQNLPTVLLSASISWSEEGFHFFIQILGLHPFARFRVLHFLVSVEQNGSAAGRSCSCFVSPDILGPGKKPWACHHACVVLSIWPEACKIETLMPEQLHWPGVLRGWLGTQTLLFTLSRKHPDAAEWAGKKNLFFIPWKAEVVWKKCFGFSRSRS